MIEINKIQYKSSDDVSGLTWYILGQPKTGKTTQTSKWSNTGSEGVIVLDTDLGTDFLENANVVPITSVYPPRRDTDSNGLPTGDNEIVPATERGYVHKSGPNAGKPIAVYSIGEIIQALHSEQGLGGFDTIVIDTIDKINEWCETIVKNELGVEDLSKTHFGSGWSKARDMVLDIVVEFQNYAKKNRKNLVLVSHSKESQITDNKVQLGPALPAGLGKKLVAMSDAIGYSTVDKETQKPILSFEAYDERTIGSRIPNLHNKVFEFDYDTIMSAVKETDGEQEPVKAEQNGAVTNNTKQMEALNG